MQATASSNDFHNNFASGAAHRSVQRRSVAEKAERRHEAAGEVDLASYGHRDVDRFAVIFDMWTCELNFLINKQKVDSKTSENRITFAF